MYRASELREHSLRSAIEWGSIGRSWILLHSSSQMLSEHSKTFFFLFHFLSGTCIRLWRYPLSLTTSGLVLNTTTTIIVVDYWMFVVVGFALILLSDLIG